jgi:hypothetical protein
MDGYIQIDRGLLTTVTCLYCAAQEFTGVFEHFQLTFAFISNFIVLVQLGMGNTVSSLDDLLALRNKLFQ